jgi:hypothetical protein
MTRREYASRTTAQIDKLVAQANERDVRHPQLVQPGESRTSCQVRVNRQSMRRIGRKDILPASQTKQIVFTHQAQNALVIDLLAFTAQQGSQHAVTTKTVMRYR